MSWYGWRWEEVLVKACVCAIGIAIMGVVVAARGCVGCGGR